MLAVILAIRLHERQAQDGSHGISLAEVAKENQADGAIQDDVEPDPIAWGENPSAAIAQAATNGKPVFMDFTADWCPACQWLKRHVYTIPEVKGLIESRFVPVKMDMTKPGGANAALFERLGISGLPSLVIFSPQGKEIARYSEQELTIDDVRQWIEKNAPAQTSH